MLQVSKITAKYQVTIPTEIRDVLKADIGDKIIFQVTDSGDVILKPVKKPTAKSLLGSLHRDDIPYVPYDEARKLSQEELARKLSGKEDSVQ